MHKNMGLAGDVHGVLLPSISRRCWSRSGDIGSSVFGSGGCIVIRVAGNVSSAEPAKPTSMSTVSAPSKLIAGTPPPFRVLTNLLALTALSVRAGFRCTT